MVDVSKYLSIGVGMSVSTVGCSAFDGTGCGRSREAARNIQGGPQAGIARHGKRHGANITMQRE